MTSTLKMWDLAPSPNSKKVRLALGYKGLEYERVAVNPQDRAEVVAVSGQPLTPVLQHGETVVWDSNAILRYLDANVKREPRLYSEDYEEMKRIEGWEAWRTQALGAAIGSLFGQFFAEQRDTAVLAEANGRLAAAMAYLEGELNEHGVLVGDAITAADLQVAAGLGLAFLSPEHASSHPILAFFKDQFRPPAGHERVRDWFRSVNRFDR